MARVLVGKGGIQNEKETMQSLNGHWASYLDRIVKAHLATDKFRVKYETELTIHQSVESDIHGLHKVIDDTSVTQLQLEAEIKALKESLFMKNHEEEVKGLQAQIASFGLTVKMEQLNRVLVHLESELAQTWAAPGPQVQALLNIKVKLEAEIAIYCCLLEYREDFNLGDALDSHNFMQTIQQTTACRTVDGKVVFETNTTKVLRH
ncbi:Keratin, type I cytoskeletal 18 [Plecturocebus cupreus]